MKKVLQDIIKIIKKIIMNKLLCNVQFNKVIMIQLKLKK